MQRIGLVLAVLIAANCGEFEWGDNPSTPPPLPPPTTESTTPGTYPGTNPAVAAYLIHSSEEADSARTAKKALDQERSQGDKRDHVQAAEE